MTPIPFTGRRDALRFLWDQLHQSFQHGPGLLLLSAPAGAGKTALVRHFLDTVTDPFVCATGRGWDNRAAVSYHALREAIFQLSDAQQQANPHIRAFLGSSVSKEVEILRPEILFPMLTDFLHQRARERPLCLFLDDLQWADEGTFAWIDYAIRQMEDTPILWIGAYRSEEAHSLTPLLERLQEWYQSERFREYVLEPFNRVEVEELTRQSIPESQWQEDLPDRVWQRSEGLPLLVVEEIRAHQEGRRETSRGQALIAARLNRLSAEDRELLSVAAIEQQQFRQDLYYRLKGMEIHLPPLRQRKADIPHLVAHALTAWSQRKDIPRPAITRQAMEGLLARLSMSTARRCNSSSVF